MKRGNPSKGAKGCHRSVSLETVRGSEREGTETDIMQGDNTIDGGGRGKGVTDRQALGTIKTPASKEMK